MSSSRIAVPHRARTLGLLVLFAALLVLPARAARLTAAHGGAIACPPAPSGWTSAPSNPTIWGPTQDPGQNSEEVTCLYANGIKRVSVVTDFALPTDPNPVSDFDYGCSTRDRSWDPVNRIYVVMSRTQWGYAELDDQTHQLSSSEVTAFESATRSLLNNSEGWGHTCKISTTETPVRSLFLFSFEYSELASNFTAFGGVASGIKGNSQIPAGSFTVATPASGSSILEKVVAVHVPFIPMTIVDHNKVRTVIIKISSGQDFFIQPPVERLRLDVQVVHSSYPSCRRGTQGTMTISTNQYLALTVGPASIQLHLCGTLFSHGSEKVVAKIING